MAKLHFLKKGELTRKSKYIKPKRNKLWFLLVGSIIINVILLGVVIKICLLS